MKLFLLKPKDGLEDNDNPWKPWYNRCFGVVVMADSPTAARHIAEEHEFGEASPSSGIVGAWTNSRYSSCSELKPQGSEGIIIQDIYGA